MPGVQAVAWQGVVTTAGTPRPVVERLSMRLAELSELPHVGEVRQRGMMIGVELVRDRATREEYDYGERIGHRVEIAEIVEHQLR